ncbi:hypothetical protein [Actinoplanes sp. NPDC051494]|uniref:hypothetical protein n=1 Tax=Actinoplanes sp. NPDC051494 TaxID=3363907 RepID=UPI003798B367
MSETAQRGERPGQAPTPGPATAPSSITSSSTAAPALTPAVPALTPAAPRLTPAVAPPVLIEARPRPDRRRTGAILVLTALVALLLAVSTNSLWLVGAAIVPVAAYVLREQSPELAAKSTAATLAAAISLILLGLGIAHA